jgi:5,10-methenyltetrahydrofolate synthetase
LGKTLYYPVMHSTTLDEAPDDHGSNSPAAWGFARTASAEDLYPRRGLYEPRATCPSAGPAELEVIVTPGLGLDDAGYRLGYGAGFYDRVLVRFSPPAFVVGVCYASERSSALPRQAHDRPVDWIVTENESGAVVR